MSSNLHKQEKAILQTLYKARRTMSIKEVAEKTDISWITAKKYLKKLEEKGWVEAEYYE